MAPAFHYFPESFPPPRGALIGCRADRTTRPRGKENKRREIGAAMGELAARVAARGAASVTDGAGARRARNPAPLTRPLAPPYPERSLRAPRRGMCRGTMARRCCNGRDTFCYICDVARLTY
ncbi:uncharacterized protein LOC132405489 isoform X2 [Hypanus sabinus]|uniref:uncharacterized protein LOC132405489 isoform X2 n=1 Tax=Hypanus sabinus TaxID=79690 RepID=UPI0028C4C4EC|nr:uncharacterized protein LOC132405489 isoform X2 [Hypanus sabinus]